MLIEKFKINNLFNYINFEYNFKEKDTIFVGENGIGKTTILSILYHVLSTNISELLKYEFESIEIKYKDEENMIISYDDLEEFNKINNDRFFFNLNSPRIKKVMNVIEENIKKFEVKTNKNLDTVEIARNLLKDQEIQVPSSYIVDALRIILYNRSIKKYIDTTTKKLKGYKILYFPTYRRIEEDLIDINNSNLNDEEFSDYFEIKNRKKLKASVGELIQFGMKDVQITIDNLLDTIKKRSINSFNKITGELLSQYVNNNVQRYNGIENLTENEVEIALNRVGTQMNDSIRGEIMEQFRNDKIKNNVYLSNFILTLVEKNKSLESIDKKIKIFQEKCNKYLYNKKFFYNQSAVTLEIKNEKQKIKISKLSSGEKQIISTFSKIYLEDNPKLIILFDEPELSLSIDWQESFIYDIVNSENCIFSISVTHSPFIFVNLMDKTTELKKYLIEKKRGN